MRSSTVFAVARGSPKAAKVLVCLEDADCVVLQELREGHDGSGSGFGTMEAPCWDLDQKPGIVWESFQTECGKAVLGTDYPACTVKAFRQPRLPSNETSSGNSLKQP